MRAEAQSSEGGLFELFAPFTQASAGMPVLIIQYFLVESTFCLGKAKDARRSSIERRRAVLKQPLFPLINFIFQQHLFITLMKYVYLLQSIPFPDQKYIGITSDLKLRLKAHNQGKSLHTAKFKPWNLLTYCAFANKSKAIEFEKYLKTGSGRAFAKKHLW